MNLSAIKKGVVGIGILIFLIGGFINIPRASATDGGGAYFNASLYLSKEYILDTLSRATARALYQVVISRITDKIKGGGPDGGPAFVQSWRNFQTNAQYRGEDVFRTILAHTSVCGYLKDDVNKAFRVVDTFKDVALKGQNIRIGDLDPFTLRAKCNMPDGFDLKKYQNDFAGNGGWEAFSRLNQSQGNTFGLLLTSLEELDRQRNLEVSSATSEATSGGGYTSLRNACDKLAGQSRCVFLKNVKTPADLVAKGAGLILDKNLEWLTNSDELSEVLVGVLSSIFGYFEDLSEAPDFNSTATNTAATIEQEKLEYCTSRKPVQEVIDKYRGLFDPYGYTGKGFGPCGDPTNRNNQNDPYPFQACVKQCLDKVGYLPTPIPLPALPSTLPEPTETQCTGFGASSCPGQGGATRPNCGNKPGSLAYDLRVHHADMYTDPSGARYLWNIGAAGDPNNPYTWVWLEAPDANDITNWCDGSAKDAWIAEHSVSSPVSTPPPYQGTRCLDGGTGVCTGSGSGSGGGGGGGSGGGGGGGGSGGTCDEGAVLDDTRGDGTMGGAVGSAVDSACSQYCNGSGGQPPITNLTAYINAVVSWLNGNGYQARWHSNYGDAKNITVKRSGGAFSEDFAIWAGTDAAPRSLRTAYAFKCTPASAY